MSARGAVSGPHVRGVAKEGGDCAMHAGVRGAIGPPVREDEVMMEAEEEQCLLRFLSQFSENQFRRRGLSYLSVCISHVTLAVTLHLCFPELDIHLASFLAT